MKPGPYESAGRHSGAVPASRDHGRTQRSATWRTRWLPLVLISIMPGCATIREGARQTIAIDTPGAPGADCAIDTAKGKPLAAVTTPGEVSLRSRKSALRISCRREGFQDASGTLQSTFNKRSRFQGPPGLLVDAISGAMWRFPTAISIPMQALDTGFPAAHPPQPEKEE